MKTYLTFIGDEIPKNSTSVAMHTADCELDAAIKRFAADNFKETCVWVAAFDIPRHANELPVVLHCYPMWRRKPISCAGVIPTEPPNKA